MIFLFRSAPLKEKLRLVFKATRQHARNLALFALVYKSALLALSHGRASGVFIPRGKGTAMGMSAKEGQYDTFVAGLVGGYTVFGRGIQSSVNQQIVIYVFARVVLALAKLAVSPPSNELLGGSYGPGGLGIGGRGERADAIRELVRRNSWPVFASLSWAMVMYLFRWHSDTLQPSLRSSMNYIYVNADHWDSLRNFIWHNK
ncbi:hypothetical protein LTR04_001457 [Oleoguttula sp. CCFEE 6159]|nr:hypothetical protein LTR04_001457 [Oleoguttula sp. CCFEE 6159]